MFSRIALTLASLITTLVMIPAASGAADQPPIRIGIVYSYTGSSPTAGPALDASISAWLAMHNQLVGGRKVQIIRRDDTGPAPDVAARQAQELVVAEHVDFLMGSIFTPDAIAIMRVSTAAKVPFFIVNAATNGILTNAPYSFRFGASIQQNTAPLAIWAGRSGIKTVFNVVSDYAPGVESDKVFSSAFTSNGGGKVLGDLHVPVTANDFTSYMQRVKDAKPEANFAFVVAGSPSIAFFKASKLAGFEAAGIKTIVNGATVDDLDLDAIGDYALGVISCAQYSWVHKSRLNEAYLAAYRRAATNGVKNPDFMAEGGYDIMSAIDRVVAAQGGANSGTLDLDKTLATLKGLKLDSPRGPIQVDPKTRELIQNIYIRKVQKVDGVLANVEFATFPQIPGDYP
jgi:branched-chain amino acid transport system substrate-binding protein